MDSDDEYQSFSPLREPSPPVERLRLKRLRKKATQAPIKPLTDSADDILSFPRVNFAELEALEASVTKTLDSQSDDSNGDALPDSIDDSLPFSRVDFARLEAEEAFEIRNLNSQINNSSKPSDPEPDSVDGLLPIPRVDFAKLEALEACLTRSSDFPSDDTDELLLSQNSGAYGSETESGFTKERDVAETSMQFGDGLALGECRRVLKRALAFDDVDERKEESRLEKSEKKRITECSSRGEDEEEDNPKRKKDKRIRSGDGDNLKSKVPAPNKRTQEKERKAYIKQLHAESQRLLRETRDASFRPVPIVSKPISSILEKIRKRKLEVSKNIVMLNSSSSVAENDSDLRDAALGAESENVSVEEKEYKSAKVVEEDSTLNQVDAKSVNSLDNSHESASSSMDHDEKKTPIFGTPIDDTQDLFGDSQKREQEAELHVDDLDSPVEEDFAPSLLAMNLKFDSVPSNDSSSEEDNDKENVDPVSQQCEDDCASPRGDPVKAFVDEEAEEEDDSDHDELLFKEAEEDEDIEDSEELNDIIATEYEEKPIDDERRNELHQKWLEQQDAAGTDNLLQKLKVSSKLREIIQSGQDKEDCEDVEEYNDGGEEDSELRHPTRVNLKKAKQIITQMFLDKGDVYLSDEDEEAEKRIVKNRLVRAEEKASLASPVEDEGSREVFGLIKKLNIAPSRKKAKASSYFDSVLKGGDGKCFSKSSFLGRSSNHPSSHKKGSTTVRSFVFGRDDSNSRSSISTADESTTDTIPKENQPIRMPTAKFTSFQSKFISNRSRNASVETASSTSLFEILKRSSEQSSICNHDDPVDLSHVMATFRIPKKQFKIEGRS